MTRHSKNCTANSVYSYHEKKKDAKASGFGSLKQRFSKDAIKDFDCCCLNLHPCRDPVVTKDGYIYEKESILEYILAKKNENMRALREYERQCKSEQKEIDDISQSYERSKIEKFLKTEGSVNSHALIAAGNKSTNVASTSKDNSISNMSDEKSKKLPSFWIPALTPNNKTSKLQKPDKKILCPMSGNPLRMKDLIPVKFTLAENDGKSLDGKNTRYKCPVTGDLLGNNIPSAVLAPTGDVVTMDCVEMIRKDMIHPITSQKLKESDIIQLHRGGTGFSSVNDSLQAKKARPVLQT